MERTDDAHIVRRLAEGDPAALEETYRAHAARCHAVALRVLQDDDLARDAVQEAFLSLWRHRGGLVVRSAGAGPWLVVVTRNAALNLARARKRQAEREAATAVSDTAQTASASASAAADIAISNAEASGLRSALLGLPEEQRAVLAMSYFEGKTLVQIADTTSTPLGTVKRRAQLALAKLARALGGEKR